MAHEIEVNDKIVYAVKEPWHGIGTKVAEVMTSAEAIIKGGLTWKILESPIYTNEGNLIDGHKAIIREDTKEIFSVMSSGYRIVQNNECFKIVDEITGTGLAKYDVIGTLRNGRVLFLTVRLPYDFSLYGGKDEIKSYLNFITSHDGSFALQALESPIRTVCMNTVRAAIDSATAKAYARHTLNGVTNFTDRAKKILTRTQAYFAAYKNYAVKMSQKMLTSIEIDSFLRDLFNPDEKEEISTRTKNIIETVKMLHEAGKGSEFSRGTEWGIFNAVTEYIDHFRGSDDEGKRFDSSLIGSGSNLREKAFALLNR